MRKPMLGEPTASPAAMHYQVAPESGGRGIGQNLADHVPRLRGQGPIRFVVVGQLQTCLRQRPRATAQPGCLVDVELLPKGRTESGRQQIPGEPDVDGRVTAADTG